MSENKLPPAYGEVSVIPKAETHYDGDILRAHQVVDGKHVFVDIRPIEVAGSKGFETTAVVSSQDNFTEGRTGITVTTQYHNSTVTDGYVKAGLDGDFANLKPETLAMATNLITNVLAKDSDGVVRFTVDEAKQVADFQNNIINRANLKPERDDFSR